jgi:hypothetical protein
VRAAQAKSSAAAIAASIAAEGYDSDEEVYATAKALQGEGDEELDVATRVGGMWLVFCLCGLYMGMHPHILVASWMGRLWLVACMQSRLVCLESSTRGS